MSLKDSASNSRLIEEFNYIFQKLFWNFEEIWITRLTPGYSGVGVFIVTPVHSFALAKPVIVRVGLKENILIEEKNYNLYVKWFEVGMGSTNLMASAYSDSLGAIAYSLIGNPMDAGMTSFKEYYNKNTIEKVEETVERLFNATCASWYLKIAINMDDIVEIYKIELPLDLDILAENYRRLFPQFSARNVIEYPWANIHLIDPIRWISTHFLRSVLPIAFCITHGNFNGNNIIVDAEGNPWMIDFMRTNVSCALRDFIRLETTIKFEILDSGISQSSYFNFEKALTIHDDFKNFKNYNNIPLFSDDPNEQDELVKAFKTIRKIRSLAYHVHEKANDLNIYYIGLLMQTIKYLEGDRYNSKDFILISSSLLCEKLESRNLFEVSQ